ncbi:MAG: hypothetical protein AB7P99_10440 [Vicinamibacterales bacterium]
MRTLATLFFIGLFAAPAAAQWGGQGVPPGQLPPPGLCRVWYEGTPPGRQPGAMNCDQAERIASRDRRARVIYGAPVGRRNDRNDDRWGRNDNRRVIGLRQFALDNGYRDGYEKGREDARDDDRYDPVRHSWYRSGTRGYDNDYGSRDAYRDIYREGFERGYAQGYRDFADRDDRRRNSNRTGVRRRP